MLLCISVLYFVHSLENFIVYSCVYFATNIPLGFFFPSKSTKVKGVAKEFEL